MEIRPVGAAAATEWERLRQQFWPSAPGEHAAEIAAFLAGESERPAAVWLAFEPAVTAAAIGLAEASIRPYAEDCHSGRVAYLEGWYVDPAHRRRGIGRALVETVEAWGRAEGCRELASDTALDNEQGFAAHRAVGFAETARIVCFRRAL